jgi:hypothetical protein
MSSLNIFSRNFFCVSDVNAVRSSFNNPLEMDAAAGRLIVYQVGWYGKTAIFELRAIVRQPN